ncbi:MAG TPA: LysE family translocator [Candidatus Dormibacteraeota bacterium]|jgi:threonine/homoserine/homoserine lactone efflux protein|nr:LysE family translocator [Candidatus Dormibacteraeota bacterium]
MSLDFLLVSLVVVASPGIGVLYTVSTALARGSRAGVVAALGCTVGIVPHMVAAIAGLAALLNASAVVFQAVKYAGVLYLLYLAWTTIRDHGSLDVSAGGSQGSAGRVVLTAVLINLLNPKLTIFFFAFLPQFVSTREAHPVPRMLLLSAVFMLLTFVVFVVYGLLAALLRDKVISRPRVITWMRRGIAGAFVVLAAKLAFVER